ncbi:hypothetical protein BsIDN1_61060 [Bacillus safensis]|uniref:1-(5-phosphoribosyl)-5-((5-phosphoribosylamino)methylideneamino)imidazole-4-carboxamide isomerase n=1 Tax=Bacillus safensis TaxID=561879 RepID=A0A5S9MHC7_BACIA|nr:hypothetical protein BsIDN1_61060 [Bacillus safensis]
MDGMLSGPNVESTVRLAEATGKQVIASGGVSAVADLQKAVSAKTVWCVCLVRSLEKHFTQSSLL